VHAEGIPYKLTHLAFDLSVLLCLFQDPVDDSLTIYHDLGSRIVVILNQCLAGLYVQGLGIHLLMFNSFGWLGSKDYLVVIY
jgi:hypothetical protein